MRVLEIIDVNWWNACAYYAVELSRVLAGAGHEVVVAGSAGTPAIEGARALGLEVWTAHQFEDRLGLRFLARFGRFARDLRRGRFDVVDAHRAEGQLWAAVAALGGDGPPVIRTRGDARPPRRHPLSRVLQTRLTAGHIVPSRAMQEQLIHGLGIPPERVWLIPAGIDLDSYRLTPPIERAARELRRRLGVTAETPLLVIVARLSPIKGHQVVLEAMARLDVDVAPHLLVVGQDEEIRGAELLDAARALELAGRVHLSGRVEDVRPSLAAADLQVIASQGSEAICRALTEGMALQVPAVATRVGVIPEVMIAERTGWLVEPGDADDLARRLEELLSGWPAGRARLAEAGRQARAHAARELGLDRWAARASLAYESARARRREDRG